MLAKPSDFLKNDERTMTDPDVSVALDACEQASPDAHKLLVGVPCTLAIGSDSYTGVVVRATPSLATIHVTRTCELPEGSRHRPGDVHAALDPNCQLNYLDTAFVTEHGRFPVEVYSYSELPQYSGEVYRLTNRGYRRSSYRLHVGTAVDYRDPSF